MSWLAALGPAAGGIANIIGALLANQSNQVTKAENEARDKEGKGILENLIETMQSKYGDLENQTGKSYDSLINSLNQNYNNDLASTRNDYASGLTQSQNAIDQLRNDTRYNYNNLEGKTGGMWDNLINQLSAGYSGERSLAGSAYDKLLADQTTGYTDRLNKAMGMLEGAGDQERKDIQQNWKEQAASGASNLTRRGLAGTSIMPTMQTGYNREMNADLGRLNDRLINQRTGLYSGLSGDLLNAQGQIGSAKVNADQTWGQNWLNTLGTMGTGKANAITGIGQNAINADTSLGTAGVNNMSSWLGNMANALGDIRSNRTTNLGNMTMNKINALNTLGMSKVGNYGQTTQNLVNWIGNREDPYVDMAPYYAGFANSMNALGTALTPAPRYPSNSGSTWGSGAMNLAGTLGGGWLASL